MLIAHVAICLEKIVFSGRTGVSSLPENTCTNCLQSLLTDVQRRLQKIEIGFGALDSHVARHALISIPARTHEQFIRDGDVLTTSVLKDPTSTFDQCVDHKVVIRTKLGAHILRLEFHRTKLFDDRIEHSRNAQRNLHRATRRRWNRTRDDQVVHLSHATELRIARINGVGIVVVAHRHRLGRAALAEFA